MERYEQRGKGKEWRDMDREGVERYRQGGKGKEGYRQSWNGESEGKDRRDLDGEGKGELRNAFKGTAVRSGKRRGQTLHRDSGHFGIRIRLSFQTQFTCMWL